MQVKGTLILDYVKIIRANRDRDWDKWLEPEDWEIINSKILPSSWYPYKNWQRIGSAVFSELIGENLQAARAYGPIMMANMLKVYTNVLSPGEPVRSVERFERLRQTFLKDTESDLIITDKKNNQVKLKLKVSAEEKRMSSTTGFAHVIAGSVEDLIKRSGGKDIKSELKEQADGFELSFKWA